MVQTAEDFYLKQILAWHGNLDTIARGWVPGSRVVTIFARDDAVSPGTFDDLWAEPGNIPLQASATTWEAVSDSTEDNPSGTGAAEIDIPILDDAYNPKPVILELDGTTPVALPSSTNFRLGQFGHCTAGSGSTPPAANVGDVTIRLAGGGATLGVMKAGVNASQSGHYTVPAGKRALAQFILPNVAKNGDADITIVATNGDDGIFREVFETAIYQSSVVAPIPVPEVFPAKSDVLIKARSTNDGVRTTALFILVEEDISP